MLASPRGSLKYPERSKRNIVNIKPVTPKTLMLLSSRDLSQTAPILIPETNPHVHNFRHPKAFSSHLKKRNSSPLPDFIKEYMQETEAQKPHIKQAYVPLQEKSKSRIMTSKPKRERISLPCSRQRARTCPNDTPKVAGDNKVFQLYKPQILRISPRSKIRIYSTIDISNNTIVKKPVKNISLFLQNLSKPLLSTQKLVEDVSLATEPVEYLKPALTFGEKLWRLNEVSLFSMLPK